MPGSGTGHIRSGMVLLKDGLCDTSLLDGVEPMKGGMESREEALRKPIIIRR